MDFEVLISCMHQNDFSIVEKSSLSSVHTLIINQTDTDAEHWEKDGNGHRRLDTGTRGLSVSRNLAIRYSDAEICLLCDDDEVFTDGLEQRITEAYRSEPDADLICFSLQCPGTQMPTKKKRIGYLSALKICSCQLSFRKKALEDAGIRFDERFGSGTPIGSGEENILLCDCLRKGLKILYVPVEIGRVIPSESKWFNDFSESSFENHGKKAQRLLGRRFGALYCLYFAVAKYGRYKKKVSFFSALRRMRIGLRSTL